MTTFIQSIIELDEPCAFACNVCDHVGECMHSEEAWAEEIYEADMLNSYCESQQEA